MRCGGNSASKRNKRRASNVQTTTNVKTDLWMNNTQGMKQPTRERQYNKLYKAYRSVPLRGCGLTTKSGGGINEPKAQKPAIHFPDNQKSTRNLYRNVASQPG